jgi:hypothetical protein
MLERLKMLLLLMMLKLDKELKMREKKVVGEKERHLEG